MKHLEPYISRLKSHGYKVTHQRLVVLDYLQRSREHPSAEIIYNDLKERYPTISLATIYNTLEMLTKVGLVLDLGAPEERRRFDGIPTEHSHFFCTNCGMIEDLIVSGVDRLMEKVKQDGSRHVERFRLDFFGLCSKCQSEKGEQQVN